MAKGANPANGPLKFGRYQVLTQLGQGAMATVYLAEDPSLNRMVAVKAIHSHLTSNLNLLERFTIEAKTAAVLRNPNIVEIFDYGIENGAQYLVMEYIDGPNLQFILNLLDGRPIDPDICATLICQAAEGLIAAEKHTVVHRDIKPENMMFSSEGVLKIADFGIAHISEQNMTRTGSILGSPNFMSPEQVDGRKPSHQTDMFALGAVLYYCLTGRKPFTGTNIPTIMRNICDLPHPPLNSLIPSPDPFLENLVETLLQKLPENRGGGARWLSLQLRGYLNQKGILDLPEKSKSLLDEAGKANDQTLVAPVAAGAPPQTTAQMPSAPKAPLAPGLKLERKAPVPTPKPPRASRTADPTATSEDGTSTHESFPAKLKGNAKWIGAGTLIAAMLIVILVLVLRRGGEETPPRAQTPPAVSVELQPASVELEPGQTRRLIAQVQPPGADTALIWESGDSAVATVIQGEIKAGKPGRAEIRAVSALNPAVRGIAELTVTGAKREAGSGARPPAKTGESSAAAGACILSVISAPPFADVLMDGHPLGTAPFKGKRVPAGRHSFQVNHPHFPTLDTVIFLSPGERTIKFKFFRG